MKGHIAALGSLLLSTIGPCVVESQQHVKLFTASVKFNLSITSPGQDHALSTYQHFQFESATSRLFHTALSNQVSSEDSGNAKSRVVVTSVHVERMRTRNDIEKESTDEAADAALSLESVVSVTFSDVGLYKAVERAPAAETGLDDDTALAPNLAGILTNTVSTKDIMAALLANELVAEGAKVSDLSFTGFDGSLDERGVYATETDIVSKSVNDGWPMFFAGVMMSLLVVSIIFVSHWLCNKNKRISEHAAPSTEKSADDNRGCKSVHYVGEIDLEGCEVATTASGVLGLKGHHPQAENDENAHPNSRSYRRKRRGLSSSSQTSSTADIFSPAQDSSGSPRTQRTAVMSASSKHPLGITSMRKLESFMTPQKPRSDRLTVYDIDRLTRT